MAFCAPFETAAYPCFEIRGVNESIAERKFEMKILRNDIEVAVLFVHSKRTFVAPGSEESVGDAK